MRTTEPPRTVMRCKSRAIANGLLRQCHSIPIGREWDFVLSRAMLLKLEANKPEIAGFARDIFAAARNNPGPLKTFLAKIQ